MDGRHHGVGIAVVALFLVAPAAGSAATQILGAVTSDVVAPTDCAAGDTWVERSAAPSTPYSASGAGVITSWSMRGGAASFQVKLKLLQPAAAGDTQFYTARAETAEQTIAAG